MICYLIIAFNHSDDHDVADPHQNLWDIAGAGDTTFEDMLEMAAEIIVPTPQLT